VHRVMDGDLDPFIEAYLTQLANGGVTGSGAAAGGSGGGAAA